MGIIKFSTIKLFAYKILLLFGIKKRAMGSQFNTFHLPEGKVEESIKILPYI